MCHFGHDKLTCIIYVFAMYKLSLCTGRSDCAGDVCVCVSVFVLVCMLAQMYVVRCNSIINVRTLELSQLPSTKHMHVHKLSGRVSRCLHIRAFEWECVCVCWMDD